MRKFLYTCLKFCFVLLLFVVSQFLILKSLLNIKNDFHIPADKTILIVGDSRAETSLNDNIIKNSVNIANGGDPFFFGYIKIKKMVKSNKHIKTVLITAGPLAFGGGGFYEVPKMKDKIIRYFYFMEYKDFYDIIKYNFEGLLKGITGIGFYYLKSSPQFYNSNNLGDYGIGKYRPLPVDKSSLRKSIGSNIINNNGDQIDTVNAVSPVTAKYLNEIIKICEQEDIKLILIRPPLHSTYRQQNRRFEPSYQNFIKKINSKKVEIWDFENLKFEDEQFYDITHLNSNGSEIFSVMINNKLN